MGKYYAAMHDLCTTSKPAAAQFTRSRAEVLRGFGLMGHQVGEVEVHLTQAAVTSAIPTMFWMVFFVFVRPDLVNDLKEELKILGENGVIDLRLLEQCPLFNAAHKEIIRVIQQQVAFRRLLKDTTITDLQGR